MRIGIFADVHDHLAHLRLAVERFNKERVELVLFAVPTSPLLWRLRTSYCPATPFIVDDLNGLLESKLSITPPPLIEIQSLSVIPRTQMLFATADAMTSIVRVARGVIDVPGAFRSAKRLSFLRSLSSF